MLKKYEIRDGNLAFPEVLAIIDPREMVEIRHGLNAAKTTSARADRIQRGSKKSLFKALTAVTGECRKQRRAAFNRAGIQFMDSAVKS